MRRTHDPDIELDLIRPGDPVTLRWEQSIIAGPVFYGPYGELCVQVINQPITFARPNRNDRLTVLTGVKLLEHQGQLW